MGIIQKQSIQNTIITYLGIGIAFINLLFIQPYFLTPEELGLSRVLFSFSTLISTLIPLGITNIIIKYFTVFKNPEKGHYGFPGFIILFFLIGYIFISLLLFLSKDFLISQYAKESKLFADYFNFVFPFSFVLAFILVLNSYSYVQFKTTIPSLLNDVIVRVLSVVLVGIYFLKWITLTQYVILFVGIYGLQLLILLFYIFQHDKPSFKIDFGKLLSYNLKEIIFFGLFLSIVSFSSLGIKYIDSVIMAKYLPLSFVAAYTIAAFIPTIIEAPLNSLDKIASVKMAEAIVKNNQKEIKDIYYKSCKYMLVIGGLLFLLVTINIHYLLNFLPVNYHQGSSAVYIISIGTLFNMATGSNTSLIFNSGNDKQGGIMLLIIMAGTILLNIFLIPQFGLNGAAMATALSSLLYNLFKYGFIWLKFKLQPFDRETFIIILLIVFCWLVHLLLPQFSNNLVNITLHSFVIGGIYFYILYFLKIGSELYSQIPFVRRYI